MWDPAFLFYDINGNELNYSNCGATIVVDRKTGEFTQILTFSDKDVNLSKIAKIGTFTGVEHIELLKDQAIIFNFK